MSEEAVHIAQLFPGRFRIKGLVSPSGLVTIACALFTLIGQIQAQRKITLTEPRTRLDTLSIVPESFSLSGLDTGRWRLDAASATLLIKDSTLVFPLEVEINYRTFPFDFSKTYRHKSIEMMREPDRFYNPFRSDQQGSSQGYADLGDLEKRGSISRGLTLGNNQNLSVNSSLNLQLTGKLNERYRLVAAISDENIPIQPDGNTQQLQDFDQVFVQVYDDQLRVTAGDFQRNYSKGYFMRYNKKLQGLSADVTINPVKGDTTRVLRTEISGAVSRGKFARKTIQGIESNQGPYRLSGAEGERFIVILSGTERVYVDGRLLVRGQEHDYIINYNTAEVIFTARLPITKDRRIVIEFQYSDRNYARSLLHSDVEYATPKLTVGATMYSEQDAKNQALQQDLTANQTLVLNAIGDSLDQAFASSVDTAQFSENQLLYARMDSFYIDNLTGDTVLVEDVLVYSIDKEIALYQATFTDVGQGNGNYVFQEQLALGRIYRWVAPVNGQHQGQFEPVVFLVTPKMRQMVSLRGSYQVNENLRLSGEWAGSNNDINTFSTADKGNDMDMAIKTNLEGSQPVRPRWKLLGMADYEMLGKNFREVERFRSVEFDRDWNIRDAVVNDDQHVLGLEGGAAFAQQLEGIYVFKTFQAGRAFDGIQHGVKLRSTSEHVQGKYEASQTNQKGNLVNSDYFQHNTLVAVPIWRLQLGYKDDYEQNKRFNPGSDSLTSLSYKWWEWEASISTLDSFQNKHKLSYAERTDWLKTESYRLGRSTFARIYGYEMGLAKNENSQLTLRTNYRTLDIVNAELTSQKRENTLLGRVEYALRLWKGTLISNTFYEVGSGLENKREYIYIETPIGQGTHIHVDYNGNGIKEINEFELAVQADQVASANFLKVFVPTSDYIRVFTNQLTQSLMVRPAAIWSGKKGLLKLISRFSNQFTFSSDRKNVQLKSMDQYNPFYFGIPDSVLQSINSNLRNTAYFNQTNPTFGSDFNYQRLEGRNLLTNGFERRRLDKRALGARWNFSSLMGAECRAEQGLKISGSDAGALSSRNYRVVYRQVEPKLNVQPGSTWRISLFLNYREEKNVLGLSTTGIGQERSIARKSGVEMTLSSAEKGSLLVNFSLVNISYSGNPSSAVGFEMLQGLQPGTNMTWGLNYQRTLANNLQLSLTYNGRQSPGLRTIHTGGVQVRAFF